MTLLISRVFLADFLWRTGQSTVLRLLVIELIFS